METKQKPIKYTLDNHEDILNIIKKSLPDYIKISYIDSEMNGQNGEIHLFINDKDFLKCPENMSFKEFCEEISPYDEGI